MYIALSPVVSYIFDVCFHCFSSRRLPKVEQAGKVELRVSLLLEGGYCTQSTLTPVLHSTIWSSI